jgi:hypothetical protein
MPDVTVAVTPTRDENTVAIHCKITSDLDEQISKAARETGVSKVGVIRMALPLGIKTLLERLDPDMQ